MYQEHVTLEEDGVRQCTHETDAALHLAHGSSLGHGGGQEHIERDARCCNHAEHRYLLHTHPYTANPNPDSIRVMYHNLQARIERERATTETDHM